MDKNTTRHSERCYARNSFGMFAYGKGLNWILRFAQNDGWVKTLGCFSGLPRKVNLARNDGQWESAITKKISFTMAEILLSLTIIGVVAAITLPSLTGNINEKTWNTQRKALYARMSQAIALMPYINGYGIGQTPSETKANAAKAFVTEGLSKVLKINNICDNAHLTDCGLPTKIISMKGSKYDLPKNTQMLNSYLVGSSSYQNGNVSAYRGSYSLININTAAFETANGESVLTFYQPFCQSDEIKPVSSVVYPTQPYMCANFIYDLNGKKGPNTFGKDIGAITLLYSINPIVVAPNPFVKDTADVSGSNNVNSNDTAMQSCRLAGGRLPTIHEAMSMFYNYKFLDWNNTAFYRTVKFQRDAQYWAIATSPSLRGFLSAMNHNGSYYIRCIEK